MVSRANLFGWKRRTEVRDVQRDVDTLRKDLRQVRNDLGEIMGTLVQIGSERKDEIGQQLRDARWGMQPVSDAYESARDRLSDSMMGLVQGAGRRIAGTLVTVLAIAVGVTAALLIKKLWWDNR